MKYWRTPLDIDKISIPQGEIHVVRERCKGCKFCVQYCPKDVLVLSTEFNKKTPHPVICLQEEQKKITAKGATMRLGRYVCKLKKDSKSRNAYKKDTISERHRHRYELNNGYREKLEQKGLIIAGVYPRNNLVEIVELKNHPWFVACQFHPEFKSKPDKPHPLFREFIILACGLWIMKKRVPIMESNRAGKISAFVIAFAILWFVIDIQPLGAISLWVGFALTIISSWSYFRVFLRRLREVNAAVTDR